VKRQQRDPVRLGILAALAICGVVTVALLALGPPAPSSPAPPPAGGYFRLVAVSGFASLPSDAGAAAMVHRSSWEPRPQNARANKTVPPAAFFVPGYAGMENQAAVFGRVTGNFTGTTDEILQWAAAKWGLPDEVVRADAVDESNWFQGMKAASGSPINGQGYGDFGDCGGSPTPSGYGPSGPSSFGLMQVKYCALRDDGATNLGGWPWIERSAAYGVDLWAAVIRGCYQGWDTWLGPGYRAGDLWGCLGRWHSGEWYSPDARAYIARVQHLYTGKPWRSWPH
jgi:autotransporter family porin